jgi:FkbM family methyltransferase
MSRIRQIAKSSVVLLFGRKKKARKILGGLAAGFRICVSPSENLGYLLGTTERRLQQAIRSYVSSGDTVYDIGANIGYISLALAKQVGPQGQVIAFEPIPQTFDSLSKNVALNKLSNIKVLNIAASDRAGETTIRTRDNPAESSMVWYRNDPSATEVSISTSAIDDLVRTCKIPPPDFVKIDVEGAEGLVVQGMRDTLATSKPVLFLECSDIGRETTWPLLCELGYRCQSATTWKRVVEFDEYRDFDFLWLPPNREDHLP